jgi:hypothetical protein
MNDNLIRRGGYAGGLIAFVVTLTTLVLRNLIASGGYWMVPMLAGSTCFALVPGSLGYFAGKEGARSKTVAIAFIKGAVFFGCAMSVCIAMSILAALAQNEWHVILVAIIFSCLIIATASLISGMAAIVVRDYRQFGRTRLIPQFTLQELMIVTTLVAVILSTMTSMAFLRS